MTHLCPKCGAKLTIVIAQGVERTDCKTCGYSEEVTELFRKEERKEASDEDAK